MKSLFFCIAVFFILAIQPSSFARESLFVPGNCAQDSLDAVVEDSSYMFYISRVADGDHIFRKPTNAQVIVGSTNFNSGMINDPMGLIESRVAGLTTVKPGGNPNELYETRIRGLSSILGSTAPLVIIDGVLDADLQSLDPGDVESFEILKDVAATAFYGIRGANGVVLIRTKRGQSGDLRLSYNTYFNAENAIRRNDNMSGEEFVSLSNDLGIDYNRFGADTDWYDEILQTGLSQVHNLSVSGGSGQTDYYISMNYRCVDGTLKSSGFNRFNTRFNLNHRSLNDKLTIGINFGATFNQAELSNSDAFKYAAIYNPTAPVRSDDQQYEIYDGYFQQVLFDFYNPVAMIEQNTHNGGDKWWNAQLMGTYEIFSSLDFHLSYAYQTASNLENHYFSKYSFGTGLNRNGLAEKEVHDTYNQMINTSFVWNPDLQQTNLTVMAGYAYQEFINEGFMVNGGDFITDAYTYNRLNAANDFDNGLGFINSYKNSNKIIGFYGSAIFDWKQTYFLSVVGRYDGSSRFGADEKYGFYPGVSAGVDLAQIITLDILDLFKIRLGTGRSGQGFAQSNLSQDLVDEGWGHFFYGSDFTPFYSLINQKDESLKAPSKTEINIGVDFQLWQGRVYGSFDYYSNSIKDLLMERNVATPPNLVRQKWLNIGELKNNGWELSVSGVAVKTNSILYEPSLIMSKYIDNSTGSLSDAENGFGERFLDIGGFWGNSQVVYVAENSPIGDYWGYEYEGISEDGNWIHKDLNDDGEIRFEDKRKIANGMPKFELGFGNTLKYRSWDVNLFFKGVFGYDLLSQYKLRYGYPNIVTSYNPSKTAVDFKNANGTYLTSYSGPYSTCHVEKGNYFKLANFNIGYNFNLAETSVVRGLRLYLMGQNLFVLTNYSGSDPEARYNSDVSYDLSQLAPGFEPVNSWLMTRSFALGLRATF
jgi:iron complex outermembrane receptor protein